MCVLMANLVAFVESGVVAREHPAAFTCESFSLLCVAGYMLSCRRLFARSKL